MEIQKRIRYSFFVKRHFKFFGNFTKEGFRIFEEIKMP
jgi:hypothetical protein